MKFGRTSLLALAIIAAIPGAAIAQNSSKTPAPPLPPQTSTEIPEPGDSFRYKNLNVLVTKAEERRALEINITLVDKKENEDV